LHFSREHVSGRSARRRAHLPKAVIVRERVSNRRDETADVAGRDHDAAPICVDECRQITWPSHDRENR
jgi:hypothetical protein